MPCAIPHCDSAILALVLLSTATASAPSGSALLAPRSNIIVNSLLDLPDANLLDGVPDADLATAGLQTTLRAAIMHANGTGIAESIELPEGTFALTFRGSNEDAAATGDLDVLGEITLIGAGAALTIIDGKKLKDRAFDVHAGARLTGSRFTVRSAKAGKGGDGGGGFLNTGELNLSEMAIERCSSFDDGGAIEQLDGDLLLADVTLRGNKAKDDGGAIDVDGGAATLRRVTFVSNKAGDEGGGIENSSGFLIFENVTFSGNKASSEGGGYSGEDGGPATLESCTFAGNKAKRGGAIAVQDTAGTTQVHNCLFGNNGKTNATGPLFSIGGNLDFGTTCGFGAQPSDLFDTDPLLLPLGDNGGFTPTHAINAESPCVDRGNDLICVTEDQRRLPRVDFPGVGTTVCDIGAFELQAP